MNRLTKAKYYAPVVIIGIVAIGIFGMMAVTLTEHKKTEVSDTGYIAPTGIEALDLNIDTIKVIVENQSQIPLLDPSSDYAYDGFVSRDNGTNIDVIFTVYDKTNSSLANIPGIKHGPEFTKVLNDFIIYVDSDKMLGVYARK